jgi:hypothetical protein
LRRLPAVLSRDKVAGGDAEEAERIVGRRAQTQRKSGLLPDFSKPLLVELAQLVQNRWAVRVLGQERVGANEARVYEIRCYA